MDKQKLLTVSVILLLVLNTAIVTFLFMGPPSPPELFRVIVEKLELTKDQQDQFFLLRDEHHAAMEELNHEFQMTFEAYLGSLQSSPSWGFLDSLENKMAHIEKEKAHVTRAHFNRVKGLCNPEQKKKFDALLPEILKFIARERRPPRPR